MSASEAVSVTSEYPQNDALKSIEIGSAALMIMTRIMKNVRRVDIMSSSGTDLKNYTQKSLDKTQYKVSAIQTSCV